MSTPTNRPTETVSHTQGPWYLLKPDSACIESPSGNVAVANLARMSRADALLIAAAPDLLAACQAQHEAIDRLFAMLIVLTCDHTPADMFFPTKSGQPWEACQLGVAAIDKAGGTRR